MPEPNKKKPGAAPHARPAEVPAPPGTAAPTSVAVPRAWLIALTALFVVPWLFIGWGYLDRPAVEPESAGLAAPPAGPDHALRPGPWGTLTVSPIIISPPLEYVGADWGRDPAPAEWHFPGTSRELLDAFLRSAGLAAEDVGRLQAAARPEPETQGLVIKPDREMVRRMAPEVRARLYLQLAKSSLNFDQTNAFRFYGTTSEDWFANALISPRTRAQIEPLLYREGDHLYFADADLIRSDVGDTEELRRLAKTLLRESTLLVRLAVENVAEVDTLVEYWGIGGRRTDLRPLLESVAGRGLDRSIDVIHLLPTFARNHLYRYPKLTTGDLIKPLLANCLWTALNFFRAEPDDRFLDVDEALRSLREDYYIVETDFRMGDIVGFTDERGNLFHVAVYLADDIVFSKNGMSQMAPWSLTTVDRLKSYYRSRSANPRLIFHRLNDF